MKKIIMLTLIILLAQISFAAHITRTFEIPDSKTVCAGDTINVKYERTPNKNLQSSSNSMKNMWAVEEHIPVGWESPEEGIMNFNSNQSISNNSSFCGFM